MLTANSFRISTCKKETEFAKEKTRDDRELEGRRTRRELEKSELKIEVKLEVEVALEKEGLFPRDTVEREHRPVSNFYLLISNLRFLPHPVQRQHIIQRHDSQHLIHIRAAHHRQQIH